MVGRWGEHTGSRRVIRLGDGVNVLFSLIRML